MTLLIFPLAAVLEIAGCFAFWAVLRLERSNWWLMPGVVSLVAFAWLLTLSETTQAARAYAGYGGVYIVAAMSWLWAVEGTRPDRWDVAGGLLCLAGAVLIVLAPRGG